MTKLFNNPKMGNAPQMALAAVPRLTHLDLTETNQTEFPCIACLRHTLEKIYLSDNSLTVILESRLYDDILCQCNNKEVADQTNIIKTLSMSHNPGIQQLNRTFMLLFTKLAYVHIKDIGLIELPYVAHLANKLRILDASHNVINDIPEEYFSSMSNLEELWLGSNKIKTFPVFANRMSITHLSLAQNRLTQVVTKDIKNLPYLNKLYLAGNKIKFFEFFYRPKYLETLDLSDNKLPMLLNGSLPVKGNKVLSVDISDNPLLCTKESICWLKSEWLYRTRYATVQLSTRPCHRPARFVGVKWGQISKKKACDGES